MNITHTLEEQICKIKLEGQLALDAVKVAKDYIQPLLENTQIRLMIFDCAKVVFVDSKGVSLIMITNLALKQREAHFALVGLNEKIMEVFHLSGLVSHIRICASEQEAIKSIPNYGN